MERSQQWYEAAAEAILFSMGESVDLATLSAALELTEQETKEILKSLRDRYKKEHHGISLLKLNGAYQLSTKPEYYEQLIRIASHPKKPVLTDVVMETLSIIAYRQPVTKAEIEKIRGVKSDHAVNRLVEYDLVEEVGRLDAPGRPILFGTTETFLRYFGISSTEQLPVMDPVQEEDFRAEAEAEIPVGV